MEVTGTMQAIMWGLGVILALEGSAIFYLVVKMDASRTEIEGFEGKLAAHLLYIERTFAKSEALTSATNNFNQQLSETTRTLTLKMDNVQKSVQDIALIQAKQSANIDSITKNLETIANDIKSARD